MYQSLGNLTLKNGEQVEAGVVRGPDLVWAPRLLGLLAHKGDPWNWQNSQVLERDLGVDVNFYILHRAGSPFSNIMTVEKAGVGHFGHVWTEPGDRQKGASSQVLRLVMGDFAARGGQALFLGTEPDSVPHRLYASFGFAAIEPASVYMAYYRPSQAEFDATYFAPGPVAIQPLAWQHWPASAALFLGDYPGLVRCVPLHLIGRTSTEEPLLPALLENENRQQQGEPPTVIVLQQQATSAVVGLAAWGWHPLWPETCVVDCYCHPHFWQHAPGLLHALQLPSAQRVTAYVDGGNSAKSDLFAQAGFQTLATLPRWIAVDPLKTAWVDVQVMVKRLTPLAPSPDGKLPPSGEGEPALAYFS